MFKKGYFYILANRLDNRLGYYLLKFPEKDVDNISKDNIRKKMFIMNCKNKPMIGGVNMDMY